MNVRVIQTCPLCLKESSIVVDEERYERFIEGQRMREPVAVSGVQVLFPELTAGEREMLISGSHEECFDKAFAPEGADA